MKLKKICIAFGKNKFYKYKNIFKKIFKYQHGYAKNCLNGNLNKCPVCSTPWPKKQITPTEKYLESIGYYNKYRSVFFPSNEGDGLAHVGGVYKGGYLNLPEGMTGEEVMNIARILKPEYDILTKGTAEKEVEKRGAL